MRQRKKVNSPRVNLIISLVFHSLAIGALFFFAGREGMLGKRLKQITVSIAPKEKKPEPPKPKPAEPKLDTPKPADTPRPATVPPPTLNAAAPPPAVEVPPAAAPPSVSLPAFVFNDGAKDVQTTSDVNELYKGVIERALRSRWNRPEEIRDENYVADIELTLDKAGAITRWQWVKASGDKRWDDSVKQALAQTKSISRPPPKTFPDRFVVRFDVESAATETPVQLSSQ
jgi:outer membrane biosynthesis protein TonB